MNGYREYSDLIEEWIQGVYANRGINAVATLEYCDRILEYGKKNQDDKLIGFSYYYSAETCIF